jgi:hypothetical protein
VLVQILIEKGHAQRAETLLPLHMFLEFGASERVLINLMSLGLSRTSAILLKNGFSRSEYDAAGVQELSRCSKSQSDRDSGDLQGRDRSDAGSVRLNLTLIGGLNSKHKRSRPSCVP